eukprot:8978116-Alexandrium_andersonii.AAC.1
MHSGGQPPVGSPVAFRGGLLGRVHGERAGSPAAADAPADPFDLNGEMAAALGEWTTVEAGR